MPPVCRGLAVHSAGESALGPWQPVSSCSCGQGCFWGLPEVLLHALVVLQLPLDVLKFGLQARVARGNRTSLVLTAPLAGPRLNGGSPGACCVGRPQVHTCSFRARPRQGACEVPRKEQTGVGDSGWSYRGLGHKARGGQPR